MGPVIPTCPRPGEPGHMRAVAIPWKLRCWRRRRCWCGRRFVPPGKRPSTGVAARKGRERPRHRTASAAPSPTGGVAHAPRVGASDVLGRQSHVDESRQQSSGDFPQIRAQKRIRIEHAYYARFLEHVRTIVRHRGARQIARKSYRFTPLWRSLAHEFEGRHEPAMRAPFPSLR
jgi:hypothetical protein